VDDVFSLGQAHSGESRGKPSEETSDGGRLTGFQQKRSAFKAIPTLDGKVVFPPGALASMFNAAVMALILQCGTAVAATIIVVFTPTVGLGCCSLGYIIYGRTAIVTMFLNITSTNFARISGFILGDSKVSSPSPPAGSPSYSHRQCGVVGRLVLFPVF